MMNLTNARILLVLTAVLWSTGGFLIKLVDATPLFVAGSRSLIAGILLWLFYKPKLFPLTKKIFSGAFFFALTVTCFVVATKWSTAANAILLQSTAPIYVALLGGLFLKEKIQRLDVLTIILVIIGMGFFFKDDISLTNLHGNIFGLISGLGFALFILITRKYGLDTTLKIIILGNFITALVGILWAWDLSALTSNNIFGLIILGVVQLAIPYALYTKAISHVTAIETSLIALIEPVLNPIWVFLILGEMPGRWAMLGGLMVLSSVSLRSFVMAKNKIRKKSSLS